MIKYQVVNFKLLENVQSRNYISKKLHGPNELVSKQTLYYMMNFILNWNKTQVLHFQDQEVQKVFCFVLFFSSSFELTLKD